MWFTTLQGKQVPLGVTDPADEARAWESLRAIVQGAVREAITPTSGVKPGTVADLAKTFLGAKKPDVKPRTLRGYGQYLGWLAKHFGGQLLVDLDPGRIGAQAAAEAWSDTHRANTLWCVNVFLRWCGRAERLPLPPKESRGADAVIPEAVHRRVLAETKGDFRALVQFLWLTGCRPGEATGLTAEAVDRETKTARIKRHKTRHKGKTRTLHLCAEALAVAGEQSEKYGGAGHLFRGLRGKPFSLQAMVMRFERVSEKVGHKVLSYGYRHAWATRALALGIPDTHVAAALGHSSTAMVHRHYSHLDANARLLNDVVEKVAAGKGDV
jgi:integrase